MNPACERFRDAFEPRAPRSEGRDAHRRTCRACATWAARLETFTASAAPRPLPEHLRRRLRGVARETVACGEVERLWRGARERARSGSIGDPRVADHLRTCRRCGVLYATLGAAFAVARAPVPEALVESLRAIVRRPALPWWIRDGAVAVAASAILTVALTALVGDPAAFVSQTRASLTTTASSLAEAGAARRAELVTAITGEVEAGYARGLERLEESGAATRELWRELQDFYDRQIRDELFPGSDTQGDDDDDRTREGTT